MSRDFSSDQGGIETRPSTEFSPVKDGAPSTGFNEAPKGTEHRGAPGQGIGNSRRGIH